jgi:site-specific DNA recombinase
LEKFILFKLDELILKEKNIPRIVDDINNLYCALEETKKQEASCLDKELSQIKKEIANIVSAIKQGIINKFVNEELMLLEERQNTIEKELKERSLNLEAPKITEEYLRSIFKEVKDAIKTNSIPEIKKYMDLYVERVEVYEDYIRVVFIVYILVVVMNG